ncbi:hypothetical protein, partial [Solirhodobacter olei]|uniref:hypothetical protein n=1 Tax=Solirhodobacter olei TaxID=2493082 RepID=UPI0019D47576
DINHLRDLLMNSGVHAEPAGDVFQLFGHVLADPAQRPPHSAQVSVAGESSRRLRPIGPLCLKNCVFSPADGQNR